MNNQLRFVPLLARTILFNATQKFGNQQLKNNIPKEISIVQKVERQAA